jgi:hypothetical protein
LKLPNVGGLHDLEINGYFTHDEVSSNASEWELFAFHKDNGQEATAEQIENILGHGCRDRANEILEGVLAPLMLADFDLWLELVEQAERDAKSEAQRNNSYYEKMAGF